MLTCCRLSRGGGPAQRGGERRKKAYPWVRNFFTSSSLFAPVSKSSGIKLNPTYKRYLDYASVPALLRASPNGEGRKEGRKGIRLTSSKWQDQVTSGRPRPPNAIASASRLPPFAGTSRRVALYRDADESPQEGSDGREELCAHGLPRCESRLDEQGKVAGLVGNLVEEDGDGGGRADHRTRIECGRHGQAVGYVVRKVGDEVEVRGEIDGGVWFYPLRILLLARSYHCRRRRASVFPFRFFGVVAAPASVPEAMLPPLSSPA